MAFVNPFRKWRCPFCGTEFHLSDCAIISTVQPGKTLRLARHSFLYRCWFTPLIGPEFARELACLECPNCKRPLPYNFERADHIVIAVLGDVGSGKSHYITVVINQLKEMRNLQRLQIARFISLTPSTEEVYMREYYNPLFKKKQVLSATLPATSGLREPLIYGMVREPGRSGKEISLIFYDVSGADIVDQSRLVQFGQPILNSDAIIFLVDPLSIPGMLNQIPVHLRKPSSSVRRPSELLNIIVSIFERYRGMEPGTLLKIPIAITLSKSDLLKYVVGGAKPPTFLHNPESDSGIDLKDFQVVDHEIREIIAQFGDSTLLRMSEVFQNVSFFAVSATGWSPDENGSYPVIEPYRCLDPLLWILWKLNILDGS